MLRPQQNLQLGIEFLADLARQFEGNEILTSASYNAGAGNVRRWNRDFIFLVQPKEKTLSPNKFSFKHLPMGEQWLDYVIRIPFDETQRYVQKVLGNLHIYNVIYSGKK